MMQEVPLELDLFPNPTGGRHNDPGRSVAEPERCTAELIERLTRQSSQILVKKLAKNDRQWAVWNSRTGRWASNQAGPLLPAEVRTSGFFPELVPDQSKPHIRRVRLNVIWPTTGKLYDSRFIWYSNKGDAENHLTVNPRSQFSELAPASFLIIFRPLNRGEPYSAVTIDAADDEMLDYVAEVFEVGENFHCRIYDAAHVTLRPQDALLQAVIEDILACIEEGDSAFDVLVARLKPRSPAEISTAAAIAWRSETGCQALNPYIVRDPGDALHHIVRTLEFQIYKQDERAHFGARLLQEILPSSERMTPRHLVTSILEHFDALYAIWLSAKQARSSRVGGSFETHMADMLAAGDIPHTTQPVFDGRKPDFILPDASVYREAETRRLLALVLTLKTTLRERWSQILSESMGCPIFLATLDESVPGATINRLQEADITLVVPESFKISRYADYTDHENVITYRSFFDRLRQERAELWQRASFVCFRRNDEGGEQVNLP